MVSPSKTSRTWTRSPAVAGEGGRKRTGGRRIGRKSSRKNHHALPGRLPFPLPARRLRTVMARLLEDFGVDLHLGLVHPVGDECLDDARPFLLPQPPCERILPGLPFLRVLRLFRPERDRKEFLPGRENLGRPRGFRGGGKQAPPEAP